MQIPSPYYWSTTPVKSPRLRADLKRPRPQTENGSTLAAITAGKASQASEIELATSRFQRRRLATSVRRNLDTKAYAEAVEGELADIHPSIGFGWSEHLPILVNGDLRIGRLAWLRCRGTAVARRGKAVDELRSLPFTALFPSAVGGNRRISTWDLNWTGHDIYQPRW